MIFDSSAGGSSNTVPYVPSMVRKPWDRGPERQGPEMLEKLSERTGGLHFHIHNNAEANEAVIKAGRALRNEYLIGYQTPDSGTSGKYHKISVKSNVPKVDVHARNGYYSP
jgi:VWFA-related protein